MEKQALYLCNNIIIINEPTETYFTTSRVHCIYITFSTYFRICITWINHMFIKLGQLPIWPARKVIDRFMPDSFRKKYGSTRLILDGFEIECESARALGLQSMCLTLQK